MVLNTKLEKEVADTKIGSNIGTVKDIAADYLSMMNKSGLFTEYTKHDIAHMEEMLKKCEWLIPQEVNLNEVEKYLLVLGIYFHDIGMVVTKDDISEILQNESLEKTDPYYILPFNEFKKKQNIDEDDNSHRAIEHYIRSYHHIRSAMTVREKYKDLGINETLKSYVEQICKSHGEEELETLRNEVPIEIGEFSGNVNCQYVAIILRLADILDATHVRTPNIVFDNFPISNKISVKEWARHMSTSGIKPSDEKPKIINFGGNVDNPDVFFAMEEYAQAVQGEINYCRKILNGYSKEQLDRYFIVIEEVSLNNVETIGFEKERIEFSVDRDNIVKLFMGDNLYRRKDYTVVRELLYNAIDACFLRRSQEGPLYKPIIQVEFDSIKNTLTVRDNGTGMDRSTVKNYLLKIGKSKYNPSEFDVKEYGYYPISKFGIGFLSTFLIADKVEILTCHFKKSDEIFAVDINDLKEYVIIKTLCDFLAGTEVKLILDSELVLDIVAIVKHWIKHLDIPIEIIIDNNVVEKIGDEGFDLKLKCYYTLYENKEIESIKQVPFTIETDNTKGKLWLMVDDAGNVINIDRILHAEDIELNDIRRNVSYSGVMVSNALPLPDYWKFDIFLYDLNINNKNKNLEPKLDRNSLKENDDLLSIYSEIEEQLCSQLSEFLKNNMDDEKIRNTVVNAFFNWAHFKNYYPSQEVLKIIMPLPWISEINKDYLSLEEILNRNKFSILPIINMYVYPHLFPSDGEYKRAMKKCNEIRLKHGVNYLDIPKFKETKELVNKFSSPDSVEIHKVGYSSLSYSTKRPFNSGDHLSLQRTCYLTLPFYEDGKEISSYFATVVGPYIIINENHPVKNFLEEAIKRNFSKEVKVALSFINGNSGFCLITKDAVVHIEAHLKKIAQKIGKAIEVDIKFADHDYMEHWV